MPMVILVLLMVWVADASAQTFGTVVMGGGGYVDGIIACPNQRNLFYARTDVGGAYRWEESTQSWIPLLDWLSQDQVSYMGIESVAVDPQSPGKLYLLAGTSYWNGGHHRHPGFHQLRHEFHDHRRDLEIQGEREWGGSQ